MAARRSCQVRDDLAVEGEGDGAAGGLIGDVDFGGKSGGLRGLLQQKHTSAASIEKTASAVVAPHIGAPANQINRRSTLLQLFLFYIQSGVVIMRIHADGALFLPALILILTTAPSLRAQPEITYATDGVEGSGVSVLTVLDSQFSGKVNAIIGHPRSHLPGINGLKPYILIIQNNSGQTINRIGIRLELFHRDRPPVVWVHTLITSNVNGLSHFPSGASMLAFPGIVNVTSEYARADAGQLLDQMELLSKTDRVIVMMDSVIFDSGLIVGPDKSGVSVRYAAERQAVRNMLRELRNCKDGAEAKEFLQSLATLTPQPSQPVEDLNRDYSYHYQGIQRGLAKFFIYRNFGLTESTEYVNNAVGNLRDIFRKP